MRLLAIATTILLLSISPRAHAITFVFDVTGGDTDLVDFEAKLSLDPVGQFSAQAGLVDGSPPFIDVSEGFRRLDLSYQFALGQKDIPLTPAMFEPSFTDLDSVRIVQGNFGAEFNHFTTSFGFFGRSAGGLFGLWTLDFTTDDTSAFIPSIQGTFV